MSYYIREFGVPSVPFAIDFVIRKFFVEYEHWWQNLDPGMIFLSFGLWSIYLVMRSSGNTLIASDAEVSSELENLRTVLIGFVIFGFTMFGISLFCDSLAKTAGDEVIKYMDKTSLALAWVGIIYAIFILILLVLRKSTILNMTRMSNV